MTAAPLGESAKDRRNQWYVGIVAVVALLAILTSTVLGVALIKITNDDHKNSEAQQAKIIALEKHNTSLEKQHGADIANESQLLAALKGLDNGVIIPYVMKLDAALNAICAKSGAANCTITFPVPASPPAAPVPPSPVVHHAPGAPTPRSAPTAPTAPAVPPAASHPGHSGSAPGHQKHG